MAEDKVVLHETADVLRRDIEKSPELVTRLQDDTFASRLNAHLQGHTVRRLGTHEFMDASWGHIGEMIATLRGKGEHRMIFEGGGFFGVNHRGPTDDLDVALRDIGWRALSNDEERVLYSAPNLIRF